MIRQKIRIILDALGHPDAELSISLVDDAEIAALNWRYLNREGPTNVIAFPMQEGQAAGVDPHLLGDVVVSVDAAMREAVSAGLDFEERLVQLLMHGVLHLCGYDHERDAAGARRMAAKSRQLLKRIQDSCGQGVAPCT